MRPNRRFLHLQMFLAPAPVKITPEMARAFDRKMKVAEAAEPTRAAAMSALLQAEHNTNREKARRWL